MTENRTARNEAWIASLVLHVALLAGIVAIIGRPREAADGPVVIATRATGHEIGLVLLDRPAAQPGPQPIVVPVRQDLPPTEPIVVPPPPPPITVRQVGHQETATVQPVLNNQQVTNAVGSSPIAPAAPNTPVTDVPGSPSRIAPGSPLPVAAGPTLPAGAATAFFGVPAIGKSVVFVLDRSASMGLDGRLDRARRELADSLRRLPPSARFQVIAYNKVAERIRVAGMVGLLPATPEAIEAAIVAVNLLPAEGGSEHATALTDALSLTPDVIYFLTDEDDLESRDVQAVTRKNHGRVCIHALCLVPPGAGESPMQALARGNRGVFKVVGR